LLFIITEPATAKKETVSVSVDLPVYSSRTLALSTACSAVFALLIGFLVGCLTSKRCSRTKPATACWSNEMQENEK
jgi:hypothetical protein